VTIKESKKKKKEEGVQVTSQLRFVFMQEGESRHWKEVEGLWIQKD